MNKIDDDSHFHKVAEDKYGTWYYAELNCKVSDIKPAKPGFRFVDLNKEDSKIKCIYNRILNFFRRRV